MPKPGRSQVAADPYGFDAPSSPATHPGQVAAIAQPKPAKAPAGDNISMSPAELQDMWRCRSRKVTSVRLKTLQRRYPVLRKAMKGLS